MFVAILGSTRLDAVKHPGLFNLTNQELHFGSAISYEIADEVPSH